MPRADPAVPAPAFGPESTRDTILRIAGQVFLSHGYEQSSMDEIALQAGVARRTLYNQFGSKKALFDATMAQMWDGMQLDAVIGATSDVQPPEEVLYTIGQTIASFWSPPEAVAFMRLVIWESSRFPELGESFFNNGREPARRAVSEYIRRLSREHGYRIDDPDLATGQFINVILGEVLLERLVATSTATVDEDRCDYLVREAVTLFLGRYRAHS
jgi:AcrR family transcriptional regulator